MTRGFTVPAVKFMEPVGIGNFQLSWQKGVFKVVNAVTGCCACFKSHLKNWSKHLKEYYHSEKRFAMIGFKYKKGVKMKVLGKLNAPTHIPTEYNKNRDKVTFSAINIGAYHEPNSTKKIIRL